MTNKVTVTQVSPETNVPKPPNLESKEVWASCKATQGCTGNNALMVVLSETPFIDGGGRTLRYTCLKCNTPWVITV